MASEGEFWMIAFLIREFHGDDAFTASQYADKAADMFDERYGGEDEQGDNQRGHGS